jgi:adenylate cyclase
LQKYLLALFFILSWASLNAQLSDLEKDSILVNLDDEALAKKILTLEEANHLLKIRYEQGEFCDLIDLQVRKVLILLSINETVSASENMIRAERWFKEYQCDSSLLSVLYLGKAKLSYHNSDIAASRDYLDKGIAFWFQYESHPINLINFYLNSALVHDFEENLLNSKKAYSLSVQYQYPLKEMAALINIGVAYANQGTYDSAYYYFVKALPLANVLSSSRDKGILYNNLAGLSNNISQSAQFSDSAVYYATLAKRLNDIQRYTENKAYLAYDNDRFQRAFEILEEAMYLKDSFFQGKRVEAVAEMEEKYEAEKKTNQIRQLTLDKLKQELRALDLERTQNIGIVIGSLLSLVLIFLVISNAQVKKNRNKLALKNVEIETAKKASDSLLLNILPEKIAKELKETGKAKARSFAKASVLFTDFKEFTNAASKLSPEDLVGEIGSCFEAFDHICDKYSVEKIKTIGDAYMAVGGLPRPNADSVLNTVLAGLEMQDFIAERRERNRNLGLPFFEMRVGIHTGPVVAGIVGVKKFQYDIWGDTVNTASRMETYGEVGKVNISKECYKIIQKEPGLSFNARETITVKGKGELEMYFARTAKAI